MIKNKKSLGTAIMAVLILFGVVLILLIPFTNEFIKGGKEEADIEICRLSALAQARTKTVGKTPIKLNCPGRQIEFFKDKVEVNGKKSRKYKFSELNEEAVNRVIAEELRLCWYKMLEGKEDVFRQNIAFQNEKVCTICSEISFNKKIKENKKFGGLLDYMNNAKVPNKEVTYLEYIYESESKILEKLGSFRYNPWNSYDGAFKINEDFIEVSSDYVAYFYAIKSSWLNQRAAEIFGRDEPNLYYAGISDPQVIAADCRRLAN